MDKVIKNLAKIGGVSDIHISSNKPVAVRINGKIVRKDELITTGPQVDEILKLILNQKLFETLEQHRNVDFSLSIEDFRIRGNAFHSVDGTNIVLRILPKTLLTFDQINFPPVLQNLLERKNGLILITGETGAGKTTSLAAMIDYYNKNENKKIITIEDPIEYLHTENKCIISQREIGSHANSFAEALRAALRGDPDIILVGELRDLETIQLALTAAETGHLVLATLHTSGAPNTINRIIDVFPGEQQRQIRSQLALSLKAVITQKLLLNKNGDGRVAAFEIMVNNAAIQNLIREDKVFQIPTVMQTGSSDGMVLMDKYIEMLKADGLIDYDAS